LTLMKLYTVKVYDLRMCMSENNPGLNYSREIISSAVQGILCDFTPSSSLFCPTCLQWPPIEKTHESGLWCHLVFWSRV